MTSSTPNPRPLAALLTLALALPASVVAAVDDNDVEELVVRGDASLARDFESVGNFTRIDEETIDSIGIVHANEAFVRVPGVWVSRGSEQEHLTAIRSGVLTGAGACGSYLILENGVPIRPSGFCNVNNLFEVNTEQASGIEVVRGPASALYGGNALHGAINVLAPTNEPGGALQLEGGPWDYARVAARVAADTDGGSVGMAFTGTTADGWRDDTGHDQQKLSLSWDTMVGDWSVSTLLSGTNLNQETGGFVVGFEAYKDDDLRDTNPNPEAFRDAWAVRVSSRWARTLDDGSELSVTPYLRSSDMTFLQHFLPGQPLEENGQDSGGVIARWGRDGASFDWRVGTQIEYAQTFLKETQDGPTTGSPFLVATRPPGTHYDYDVDSTLLAAFYDLTWHLNERLDVVHSLRVESLRYEYDNNALDGNTRDDGTTCGFGGCLYTRPADRDDDFTDAAGRVGVEYRVVEGVRTWVTAGIGYRAPQSTELYRLQRGQLVADIDSESVRSLEVGMDATGERSSVSLVGFVERTEDEILRDANGFNISAGEKSAQGIEFAMFWSPLDKHSFDLVGTWAKHQYEFSRAIGGGETISKGDDVDTAPRWMGSAHWRWRPLEAVFAELEGVYVGEYYVDAANTDEYEGHLIFNLRADWRATEHLSLSARLLNALDEKYADRADLAFGNYRYFPGLPRRVHVTAEYRF